VMQPVPTPWYEIPPLDFVSENFVPGKIHDRRTLDFELKPQPVVPTDQLMGRAEGLRRGAQAASFNAPVSGPPGVRVNPPQAPMEVIPPPAGSLAPPAIGGQPTHALPPGPSLGR